MFSPELMTHVDGGDGVGPFARGEVVQDRGQLPIGRWHASIQEMPWDKPRVNASVRDVVSLGRSKNKAGGIVRR